MQKYIYDEKNGLLYAGFFSFAYMNPYAII